MKIFDISRALSSGLAEWPGDTPFRYELKWKMAEGASVNVGAINLSVHNGTHADARFHFEATGTTMEQMPLDPYLGPAVVVDLADTFTGGRRREITIDDFAPNESAIAQTRRVLLKTNCWPDSSVFPSWIPAINSEVVAWLAGKGARLLGLDLPSVDAIDAKQLTNHYALAAAEIAIVESLDLTSVEAGIYQLAALPLKVAGSDGAPIRAVLWREQT